MSINLDGTTLPYRLNEKQISNIKVLYKTLSPHRPFDIDRFLTFTERKDVVLYLVKSTQPNGEATIAGMLSFICINWPLKTKGYIEDVVVGIEYRGMGAASYLVKKAITRAELLGCETVDLTSNDTRQEAHGLYRKFGFEIADTNLFRLRLEPQN